MKRLALISHPDCLLHNMGPWHPERPERLAAVMQSIESSGIPFIWLDAPLVSREALLKVHSERYVNEIAESSPRTGMVQLDPDTAMNPHTLNAARRAAGAAVLAADKLLAGELDAAFCNVRPPGHHACRDHAMGFCIYNNVAVGTAHALERLDRVAIVDFDVHHGNGTEDIFKEDERVMMVSIFQHPFYPYSGTAGRSERMVNIPLPVGSDGRALREAVEKHWLPALHTFKPQMIFFSAGFDAHVKDGMAGLALVEEDYAWVTGKIREVANKYAQGRMVSTLEGGYELDALGRSALAHITELARE